MIEFMIGELFPHALAHVIVDVIKTLGKAVLLRRPVSHAVPTEQHRQFPNGTDGLEPNGTDGLENGALWSSAARTVRGDRPKEDHGSLIAPVGNGSSSTTPVSVLPGRVRLRTQGLQGDAELAKEVLTKLHALPGVSKATTNVITGSVLVHYTPDRTSLAQIQAAMKKAVECILLLEEEDEHLPNQDALHL